MRRSSASPTKGPPGDLKLEKSPNTEAEAEPQDIIGQESSPRKSSHRNVDLNIEIGLASDQQRTCPQQQTTPRKRPTPRKNADQRDQIFFSPTDQALTPNRLHRTLGNISPSPGARARSRAFLPSPQTSSVSLSSFSTSPGSSYADRLARCLCRKSALKVVVIATLVSLLSVLLFWSGTVAEGGIDPSSTSTRARTASTATDTTGTGAIRVGSNTGNIALDSEALLELNDNLNRDDARKLEDFLRIPEETVFRKMLNRAITNVEKCKGVINGKRPGVRISAKSESSRFRIIDILEKYLDQNSARVSMQEHKPIKDRCFLPPTLACDVKNFTVYINGGATEPATLVDRRDLSRQKQKMRNIFIAVLRAISLPSASQVIVVLNENVAALEAEKNYGRRLLAWHNAPAHKLTILFQSGVDDSTAKSSHSGLALPLNIDNSAILYLSPDIDYSAGGLEAGFALWRRYSDSLILPDSNDLQDTHLDKLQNDPSDDMCPIGRKAESPVAAYASAPLFFFHRDYATCWFEHSIFSDFRNTLLEARANYGMASIDAQALYAISIISQVSSTPVRLFPSTLHRKKDIPPVQVQEVEGIEKNTTNLTAVTETSRRLNRQLRRTPDDLISLYFGSDETSKSFTSAIGWCEDPRGCTNTRLSNGNARVTSKDLGWMKSGGRDFEICPTG